MKKISIIVPFKNTPIKWMKKLIVSLNNQTNKNFEVFFIDDDSKDGSKYERLITGHHYFYIKNIPNNHGVGRIRDYGVTLATGDYIWFVDSDDWLFVDAVDYLLKSFYKYQNIDLIIFEYKWVFNEKQIKHDWKDHHYKEILVKNNPYKNKMPWFHNNYQTDWRVCFKKSFLLKHKLNHPENINIFEDVYYGLIWKVLYKNVLLTSKKLYFYNRMNQQSSLNLYKYRAKDLIDVILKSKNYLKQQKIFKENWYFYALNWLGALCQLDYQNFKSNKVKNIHYKFMGHKTYNDINIIGFHKLWFIYKILWTKKLVINKKDLISHEQKFLNEK